MFRNTEVLLCISKLISECAGHVFSSPKNSIWYLGLIALAKLLSPSHNTESISLHDEYTTFLNTTSLPEGKILLKKQFKGFRSNRFGRLGELSELFWQHKSTIEAFFDNQVDIHSNKLVLAVYSYFKSEWFTVCCQIARFFYSTVTLPIKKQLGIDEFKGVRVEDRSWNGTKCEFAKITAELEQLSASSELGSGIEQLKQKCANEVKTAIERQLAVMSFFQQGDTDPEVAAKRNQTVLTNLGAESEFATADNTLRRLGGSTSLKIVTSIQWTPGNQSDRSNQKMIFSKK